MSETIDELTIEHWEEGVQVVKVLNRHVLSKGAWTTIMYLYQELDRKKGELAEGQKARIVRYRKMKGVYRAQSKFNISSAKQAQEIIKALSGWFSEDTTTTTTKAKTTKAKTTKAKTTKAKPTKPKTTKTSTKAKATKAKATKAKATKAKATKAKTSKKK